MDGSSPHHLATLSQGRQEQLHTRYALLCRTVVGARCRRLDDALATQMACAMPQGATASIRRAHVRHELERGSLWTVTRLRWAQIPAGRDRVRPPPRGAGRGCLHPPHLPGLRLRRDLAAYRDVT
eukprot:1667751-Rhodomonas_salina.6